MSRRRLVFLNRPGCGLCDEAEQVVGGMAARLGVTVDTVDITTDPELEAEYHLRIPVLLDRRGRVLAEGEIGTIQAMLAVLKART